jgi:hypothetical protein
MNFHRSFSSSVSVEESSQAKVVWLGDGLSRICRNLVLAYHEVALAEISPHSIRQAIG